MKITDGKKTVEITMHTWEHGSMSPDWSIDFFEAGGLAYNCETNTYTVKDVDYCIAQAEDWGEQRGDYYDNDIPGPEKRYVFISII